MARRIITQDIYDKLVQSYRIYPGNVYKASHAASVYKTTAKRGWHEGWPEYNLRAIKQVFEEEQLAARALLAKEEADRLAAANAGAITPVQRAIYDREMARQEAIEANLQEGRTVRAGRDIALANSGHAHKLSRAFIPVATELAKLITDMAKVDFATLDDKEKWTWMQRAMTMGERIEAFGGKAINAAHTSMENDRKHLGKPESIIGVESIPDITMDEAERNLEAAGRALARAKELGISIIQGDSKPEGPAPMPTLVAVPK